MRIFSTKFVLRLDKLRAVEVVDVYFKIFGASKRLTTVSVGPVSGLNHPRKLFKISFLGGGILPGYTVFLARIMARTPTICLSVCLSVCPVHCGKRVKQ